MPQLSGSVRTLRHALMDESQACRGAHWVSLTLDGKSADRDGRTKPAKHVIGWHVVVCHPRMPVVCGKKPTAQLLSVHLPHVQLAKPFAYEHTLPLVPL